ncbi:multidrug efflux RND transporter permease subunit [Alteromonas sp. RKMC-009]|uniref:multidrug efflux RND transporter permease subunit n=1 Tax=Alteromonas sp. RKMC-009 TaxID=2267264 RepID=UPI000E67DA88|nr:multidrug efflux RND transporter permease subunit [Alteromonas sp. RKMC-009]AYA62773.1 multidrug efflux RND transporter permease subunit [Alteromonas sp. RKMC-009]
MPQFFIERPVFAWVISLFIVLGGILAIPGLPIERYPSVAPPSVNIYATYPGATPQTMNDAVLSLIERELSGVENLLYYESSADTSGMAQITVTFEPGTNPQLAQVDVQNKIKAVEPRLPQAVRQNGLTVESASSGFLMMIGLQSEANTWSEVELSNYMARNIIDDIRRIDGVGRVQSFGAEQAMRIWVSPEKLLSFDITMSEVTAAISEQNVQIAPGAVGAAPIVSGQKVTIPLTVDGQLSSVSGFENIILRALPDGSNVKLSDVATVELGAQTYNFAIREDGNPATSVAVQLAPGANALSTAEAVISRLKEVEETLPQGMRSSVPFNTAPFVKVSIEKVLMTLVEAMVLVFLVMYLFLQNFRYTVIPAIVAPIALLGTLTVMLLAGFSVNVLTMFGMVLAIGIIVDDAIVVVENVERLMHKGMSPKDATKVAMKEITGAVIGMTLVITAVFIPMAFASGSVGVIYKQFSLSMAISILFSAFLALSLTPALCATILRPVDESKVKPGFFRWFNEQFEKLTGRYGNMLTGLLGRMARASAAYIAIVVVLIMGFNALPSAFLPEEDQGYYMTSFQLPSDATQERTLDVIGQFEEQVLSSEGVESNVSILGFGFSGSGPNAALAFTMLKDWDERNGATVNGEIEATQTAMANTTEGMVMSLLPPPIDGLGTSSGFTLRLQDRGNHGTEALKQAEMQLLSLAWESELLTGVYPEGLPAGDSVKLTIDREKAQTLGVPFSSISDTLSAAMGSLYINDFPNNGRMQQVIIQADASARMNVDDVLSLYVQNSNGGLVALSEVVKPRWQSAPLQMVRYQGFPAARIAGSTAPGVSSGEAMAEMERLATQLPKGFTVAWTGQSLQEQQSSAQAPVLMALSMVVVFLVLAALYESWSIPVSVMLVVPLGLIGTLAAVFIRDMPNDVFFKVGMITVIGLSAKNAILIIEFAKQLYEEGQSALDAAVNAAKQRLRPIMMTSLAFGLGVVPLMLASGASSETQQAIGTGVFGGMVAATVLAIFFVPAFYVLVMKFTKRTG